jgi:ribosomal protein S14
MKKDLKGVTKDELNRLIYLKFEIKKRMLQSALRITELNQITKVFIKYQIIKIAKNSAINRQMSVCVLKGKHGGVYKKYSLCRHVMLKLATTGSLHNTKIIGW